jgi:hypothetical protein
VHLVTPRHGDCHHRLDAGDGKVLQSARFCRFLHRGLVEEVGIAHFAANHAMWIKPSPVPQYAGQEAVRRTRSRLGENRYRLLTNNCEQFCSWCIYGESFSEPVDACLSLPRVTLLVKRGLCKSFLKTRSAALHRWLDNAALFQERTSSLTENEGNAGAGADRYLTRQQMSSHANRSNGGNF